MTSDIAHTSVQYAVKPLAHKRAQCAPSLLSCPDIRSSQHKLQTPGVTQPCAHTPHLVDFIGYASWQHSRCKGALLVWQGKAVRELLAHRLSPRNSEEARREWYEIVEGDHALWDGVSEPYKHTIRAFLVHFHTQILRNSSERFNFRNGSVGRQQM